MIVFVVHLMNFIPIDPAQHYWLYSICLLGELRVPAFFLLSAFLITELLFRESEETGTIQLKAFYVRRILRIWPLDLLVSFSLVVLTQFVPGMEVVVVCVSNVVHLYRVVVPGIHGRTLDRLLAREHGSNLWP
jgi:peptidoglycan/LPS O-acetylase OafA/YrhL